MSNVTDTINKAVIRTNIGRLRLSEARPKLKFERPKRPTIKTPGDLGNSLKIFDDMLRVLRGK
jgi:hypothetical protein